VRAETEVDESPHGVALNLGAGLLLDELTLEGLPLLCEDPKGLGLRQNLPLDRPVLADDPPHALLDLRDVFRGEGFGYEEIVEEPFLGGWADPTLSLRKKLRHGGGEEVGTRMPIDLQGRIGWLCLARRTGAVQ
jgi:hypothetical protein